MIKNIGKYIFWIVIGGMTCFISACNNDSVSEKQGESFLKYYAVGIEDNTGSQVIQTSDGYAIMGNFENVSGQKDIFIIFTDEFGRQKTSEPKIIGTDLNDHGHNMIRLTDGTYLVSGTSFNANATQIMGYLVNISSDGTVLWEQNYSGYDELEFRCAYPASDGNIIVTGYSKRTAGDKTEAIMLKISPTGDQEWLRTYSVFNRNLVGEAIIEDYEDRYHVLTTSTDLNDTRHSLIRMYNTNTDGRFETSFDIETPYFSGKDMVIDVTGKIFILGNRGKRSSWESNIFLAELELYSGGVLTRLKDSATILYNESLHAESFALTDQNELAIGGWQAKPNDNDIMFMKIDLGFQSFLLNTYGTKGSQISENIIYTGGDGGFALTGSVDLAGGKTSMLLKINSQGELK